MLAPNCLRLDLPDTEASRVFVALDGNDRDMALRLGCAFIRYGKESMRGWSNEDMAAKMSSLEETIRGNARAAAARMDAVAEEARASEKQRWEAEIARLESEKQRGASRESQLESRCVEAQARIATACTEARAAARRQCDADLARLAEENRTLSSRGNELQKKSLEVHLSLETACSRARTAEREQCRSEAARLEAENERLGSQVAALQTECVNAHSKIEATSARRAREAVAEVRQQHDKERAVERDRLDTLQNGFNTLLASQSNSTLKGRRGEEVVLQELTRLFPNAEIEDTHKTPHRGDFIVRTNYDDKDIVMMVETKSYKANVKKCEVDKFYRDLDDPGNQDIDCALFLSLESGVAQKSDFCFEARGDRGVPVLFLTNVQDSFSSIIAAFAFMRLILKAEGVDLKTQAVRDGYRALATSLKRGFAKQRSKLNKFHQEQLELAAEQEARTGELYRLAGLPF